MKWNRLRTVGWLYFYGTLLSLLAFSKDCVCFWGRKQPWTLGVDTEEQKINYSFLRIVYMHHHVKNLNTSALYVNMAKILEIFIQNNDNKSVARGNIQWYNYHCEILVWLLEMTIVPQSADKLLPPRRNYFCGAYFLDNQADWGTDYKELFTAKDIWRHLPHLLHTLKKIDRRTGIWKRSSVFCW